MNSPQPPAPRSNPNPRKPGGFLALGDSYTIGEGVAPDQCWPAQLVRRLAAQGIAIADPTLVATTGWTSDELCAALDARALAPPYALVSLLIGVNDQYRGHAMERYAAGFEALLARAIALAGRRAGGVLVISIPDWGVTRFARENGHDPIVVATAIDAFNASALAIAAARGVACVDVTSISRECGDSAAMLVADGLHPSAAQYAEWTDRILDVARDVLRTPQPPVAG